MPVCPHCGFKSGEAAEECPLCGSRLRPEASSGEAGLAIAEEDPRSTPWEDPATAFPANLWLTWRRSLFEPTVFFRRLPYASPLARPVLYYLILSVTAAFFVLLWRSATDSLFVFGAPVSDEPLVPLIQFFFEPFAALILLGLGTLFLHGMAALLAHDRRGLGATARVFCYSSGPTVFTLFPIFGPAVGFVWSVVLLVIGMREAHRTTSGRAAAAVLIPLLAFFFLVVALVTMFVVLGVTAGEIFEW